MYPRGIIQQKSEASRSSNKVKRYREDRKDEVGQGVSLMVWVVEDQGSRWYGLQDDGVG
jgi:hypothetical protein